MAVGRDARPEAAAETFLWEHAAKHRAAAPAVPSAPPRPAHYRHRAATPVAVPAQPEISCKPAAGSGAALAAERRRASPSPRVCPAQAAAEAARTPGGPCQAERTPQSGMVPRVPAGAPRGARPPSRGTRLSAARACQAAPKVPSAQPRSSDRAPSPRVSADLEGSEIPRGSVSSAQEPTPCTPAKDKATPERPLAGPPTSQDRPVATPCQSPTKQLPPQPTGPDRGLEFAEKWLRLSRIALLELTKLPPASAIVGRPFERMPYCATQVNDTPRLVDMGEANPIDGEDTHAPLREGQEEATKRWKSMAFPQPDFNGCEDNEAETPATLEREEDYAIETESEYRAMQAWARILVRVFNVTIGGPPPPQMEETPYGLLEAEQATMREARKEEVEALRRLAQDEDSNVREATQRHPEGTEEDEEAAPLESSPAPQADNPMRNGCAHICLGELMEESVSWVDVDSEDDCCSPKEADKLAAMQAAEEEVEVELPRGMKDVYRQQNAPGIVAGMQKCLSFF